MIKYTDFFVSDKILLNKKGIYKIYFTHSKKVYIGSTHASFKERLGRHFCTLKKGNHQSKYLQRVFNKHPENIRFEIIEVLQENILEKEQYYIDLFNSHKNGYNTVPLAKSTLGFKMPQHIVDKRKTPYLQYDLEGNFVKEWESYTKLSEEFGGFASNNVLISNNFSNKGYMWRKKESNNFPIKIESYNPLYKHPILCYSLKGIFIKKYNSILDASKDLKISVGNISRAINNSGNIKGNKASNYIFKHYSENYPLTIEPWEYQHAKQIKLQFQDELGVISSFRSLRKAASILQINRGTIFERLKNKSNKPIKSVKTKKQYKIL